MASKNKPNTSSTNKKTGPDVTILNNYADFKKYIGDAGVPQEPLITQIDRLRSSRIVELGGDSQAFEQEMTSQNFKHTPGKQPLEVIAEGKKKEREGDEEEEEGGLMFTVLDYTLYIIPLFSVHLCLDILVHQQYSEPTEDMLNPMSLFMRASTALPVFALLLHIVRSFSPSDVDKQQSKKTEAELVKDKNRYFWFQTCLFFASVGLGMYVIFISNEEGYYAVMKKAPAIGTLWVFAVLIMEWNWSLASLVIIGTWSWLRGYSI
ncbi:hypothetical protein NADFUDRAFT_83131 [Nadsonia fulvescens var. elongata DSM 6958]|uniref:DUF7719 domain-containing protein n=1 Tax=Nadsonia fulvescens var. elongata DSM 6958 TaxID=857566 RepID=A0A1E3PI26_9ASCO|nr:hypothetical protein NADFUDRAFT_83131 [Nadsonia fulvescens var. elongata DSM 6958]